MKGVYRTIILILLIITTQSLTIKRMNYEKAMFKNVCKNLNNEVLLYFIFVDSKTTTRATSAPTISIAVCATCGNVSGRSKLDVSCWPTWSKAVSSATCCCECNCTFSETPKVSVSCPTP